MVQGFGFSEREKKFMHDHKEEMFYNQIANKLVELFPEDSGGSRSQAAVRRFCQKETSDGVRE
jgi:hypothetical protein